MGTKMITKRERNNAMSKRQRMGVEEMLSPSLRRELSDFSEANLEELRLRIGKPLELCYADGKVIRKGMVQKRELFETLNYLADYSLYARKEEIAQGFFTARGGHRVGICGREHLADTMEIGGVNIRIAQERKDCARQIVPWLRRSKGVCSTLFLATCGVGKTTYLRDTIRLLATGDGSYPAVKCAVVDERSEIAACYQGIPQNDLGCAVDVLDGCSKTKGMQMLLRSMSPQVIAVDELATEEEILCVHRMILSGVSVLGTVHCESLEELRQKTEFQELYQRGLIDRYVLLKKDITGKRQVYIYDAIGKMLWCDS